MADFSSSQLGTKEFWDSTYDRELDVFQDTKDIGEVWFGYDSVSRVVDWLERSDLVSADNSVLDIGCGNGYTLVELAKLGYTDVTGVDYSEKAVALAEAVAQEEQLNINYQVCDILADPPFTSSAMCRQYDLCLDKGTFDAISLCPTGAVEKKQKYITNLKSILKKNGLFIITTCNWTAAEIETQFEEGFSLLEKISSPTFTFGGVKGNREAVVVLTAKH